MATPRTLSSILGASSETEPQPATGPLAPSPQTHSAILAAEGVDPLRQSLDAASRQPVDRAQRVLQLRLQTGLPPALIEQHFDELDRRDKAGQLDVGQLRQLSPALAQWLSDPAVAAAAAPQAPQLHQLEGVLGFAAPMLRGIDTMQGNFYGALEAFGELTGVQEAIRRGREGRERNRLEAAAYGKGAEFDTAFNSAGDFGHYVWNLVGENIPQMGVSTAGALTGGAAGSFFGPAGTVVGGVIGAFLPNIAMGTGEVQGEIKELDPSASAPTMALLGGTAVAAFDTALPGKIGSRLVKTFGRETAEQIARRALSTPVKPKFLIRGAQNTIVGMSTEGLTEAVQEAVTYTTARVATGRPMDWTELRGRMAEAAVGGALVGGVFSGAESALTFPVERRRHLQAQQQEQFFKALGEGATNVELLATLPEESRAFVEAATKDGPIDTVYVPTESFEEYWQSQGKSPDVVAELLTGNREALATAKREGTLLPIRMADYATKLAATEHHAFFQKELRLRPNIANVRETEEEIARAEAGAQIEPAQLASERDEIRRRVTEVAMAGGAPRWQAEKWGAFRASRYVERARRMGTVTPLQLYDRQPFLFEVVDPKTGQKLGPVTESLMPEAVEGTRATIPASQAPQGETREGRARRRQTHLDALASQLTRDAVALDPNVSPAAIRQELALRLAYHEELQAAGREEGVGQTLLRAMAGYGGLWWDEGSGMFKGEVEQHALEGTDVREGRDKHTRKTWNGVAGVFKSGGLTPDGMVEALRQDPQFQQIGDINDLWRELDAALRAPQQQDALPGTDELRTLGIVPGTPWWRESWGAPVEDQVEPLIEVGDAYEDAQAEGDVSFDPNEFSQVQRLLRGVEQLAGLNGPEGDEELFQPLRPETTPKGFGRVAPHLLPPEVKKLVADKAQALVDFFRTLPKDIDFADAAIAGASQKGWYERSRRAIFRVFGPIDGTRFVTLLAAMSPQTSVEQNLINTVRMWKHWQQAGRPTDEKTINALLAKSVAGTGKQASVLDAWRDNAVRALTAPDALEIVLSGPKVGSFAWNLMGYVHEVTLDAWMATFAGLEQDGVFGGELQGFNTEPVYGSDPGKGPRYLAYAAKVRRVATTLTARTGETWTPENVQETIWSWAYTLYRLTQADQKKGQQRRTAVQIARAGEVTPQTLRETVPDFEKLLATADLVQEHLREAGYGRILDDILAERSDRDSGAAAPGGGGAAGEAAPRATPGIIRSARRIESIRRTRAAKAKATRDALKQARARAAADEELHQRTLIDEGAARVAQLEAFATDEAMGVREDVEQGVTVFPDGTYAVVCTYCAERIINMVGEGEVYGWAEETNPTAVVAGPGRGAQVDLGQGHDFAVIGDRYLVDAWAKNVDLVSTRAAYDLENPADRAEVFRLYGDPRTWTRRTETGWHPAIPGPLKRAMQAGEGPEGGEFYQTVEAPSMPTAAGTVGHTATIDGFFSRVERAVRLSKAAKARGSEWRQAVANAAGGVNFDEVEAIGLANLEPDRLYTREEVLKFLADHKVSVDVVEFSDPRALRNPHEIDRAAETLYSDRLHEAMNRIEDQDAAPRTYDALDVEIEEGDDGGFTAHVAGIPVEEGWEFDSAEGAQQAGEALVETLNKNAADDLIRMASEEVDFDEAYRDAERQLEERDEGRRARYGEYQQPNAVEGSYRELFLVASAFSSPQTAQDARIWEHLQNWVTARKTSPPHLRDQYDPVIEALSALYRARRELAKGRGPNAGLLEPLTYFGYPYLSDTQVQALHDWEPDLPKILQLMQTEAARLGQAATGWEDGHSLYEDVQNPIVRLRYNARPVQRYDAQGRPSSEMVLFLEEVQPPAAEQQAKMPALFRKTWRELAMRWALKHAAVNGYTHVAWTNGAMQQERWPSLRQVAEFIIYEADTQTLMAYSKDGHRLLQHEGVKPTDLGRWIGDKHAQRLMEQTPEVGAPGPSGVASARYVLQGTDLAFGLEGLTKFYDQDLPNVVNDLRVMKATGSKATTMSLPGIRFRKQWKGPTYDTVEDIFRVFPMDQVLRWQLSQQMHEVTSAMREGATFEQAMIAHGGDGLASRLGGEIVGRNESDTVPAVVMTPALREALLGGPQEFFQGEEPYQRTMFGDPVLRVDKAAPVLPTETELRTQTTRQLGNDLARTPQEVAMAMGSMARSATERFDLLLTDDAGHPLAIVGGFRGNVDSAMVHHEVILAEAMQVPGATRAWAVHNHPSGSAELSDADHKVAETMDRTFAATGIKLQGIMAIGAGTDVRRFHFAPPGASVRTRPTEVTGSVPAVAQAFATVPVQEREFIATRPLDDTALRSPALARAVVPRALSQQFGVVFINTKMLATGAQVLDPQEARALREEGRYPELLRTLSRSGQHRVFIHSPTLETDDAALNLANALHAKGVEVLDIVSPFRTKQVDPNSYTGEFTHPDEGGEAQPKASWNRLTDRIRLFAGRADLSSFLHETGHQFLKELMTDALSVEGSLDGANELQKGLVRDAHTVLRWFNFEGTIADWLALSRDQQEQMHEQWARGFEAYLMTGEAPSDELREIFATFREWLVAAYRVLRRFGRVDREVAEQVRDVQVPQEIRDVMDRLLASDEAIAAARSESQVAPLFTDAASAGVDELTFAAYEKSIREANMRAREAIDARLMQEWRRERQATWQREREQVHHQVEEEANQNPVFVALSVIRTGKMPDGTIPSFGDGQPMKLSRRGIVQMKGEAFLKTLPRPYLYTVDGGLHPDVLAELLGFSSGEAMLDTLVNARPKSGIVEAETDRRMREQHGDLLLDGLELTELAEQALHEHRAEVIAAELQALTRGMANVALPSPTALRAAAEARVSTMTVRELRPGLYLQAAQRASKKAFEAFAKNDRAAAVRAKQEELSSLALYRAAGAAKERSQKSARVLNEFQRSRGRRKTLLRAGQDYLDQVDQILERYEFTKTTIKAQERRSSLAAWVERQEQAGLPVEIPQWLQEDARRVNYTQLTVEELEGVRASVEHIAHLARLKKRLLDARDERELAEITSEIAGSIRAQASTRYTTLEPRLPQERARAFSAGILYSHRKLASIARELDGFQDGGPMWNSVIRRLNEAGNTEQTMMGTALRDLMALGERFYSAEERAAFMTKRATPELVVPGKPDASFSKQALLAMALNQGNETNRQRLRDGYGFTQEQVQLALDHHLDKRDWDFVQATWDYLESYWPQIVAKQQRVVGAPPIKVQPTPVFTRFGEYRGGYYPIKFERALSGKTTKLEEGGMADLAKAAAYVHATTQRGHLEARVEGDVRDQAVRLDPWGVLAEHLNQVIHDLTHHEALIDVGRILDTKEVSEAIRSTLGPAAFEQFRTGLRDIALGDAPARHEAEGMLGWFKNGATIVGLGWNVTTSALQFVGFTQSVHRIGAKWVGQGIGSMLRGAMTMDETSKAINDESELMRNRFATMNPEVADVRARLGIDSGVFAGWMDAALRQVPGQKITRQGMADSFLWMISRTQVIVDRATYLGARAKAMADPANRREDGTIDEARVIAIAEQAVLDSQGGGQVKDLAAVQRGPAVWKIWTNFYSFFNVTYNAWAESVKQAGGRLRVNPRNPVAVGRLAVDFFLLFTLPTVLTHVIRGVLRGTLEDELDDPEALLQTLVREQVSYMAGTMVLVRELGSAIEGWQGWEGPAGARGIGTVSRFVTQAMQLEADEAFWRTLNTSAGILFHYPAGQVERTVRGIQALIDGETENPLAVVVGPPPKKP